MRTKHVKQKFASNFNDFLNSTNSNQMFASILEKLNIEENSVEEQKTFLINKRYKLMHYSILMLLIFLSSFTIFRAIRVNNATNDDLLDVGIDKPEDFVDYSLIEVKASNGDKLSIFISKDKSEALDLIYTYSFEPVRNSNVISLYFLNETTGEGKNIDASRGMGFVSDHITISEDDTIKIIIQYANEASDVEKSFTINETEFRNIIDSLA